MMPFIAYDLKVAVLIAVFYMFYRLLLSRETFHRVNRVVLLTTSVASFVLPLLVITVHKTVVVSGGAGSVGLGGLSAVVEEAPAPLWQTQAVALFLAGMAVTLGHTLTSVLRVWLLISRSEHRPQTDGCVVCLADRDVSPFSWMHYIVLSRNDYRCPPVEGSAEASILAHERGHIRQRHSLDLLLVDTLTALQWFNPAMWMLRQDLRTIHEYEADQAVLSQGINMRQYQYLLIQKAVSRCGYSVANGISHSTLKNRINMMLNKKSSRRSMFKLLALLPIVGIALALQAKTVNDYVYNEPQKKIVKKGRKAGQIKVGANTIEVKTDSGVFSADNVMMKVGDAGLEGDSLIVLDGDGRQASPLILIDGQRATVAQMDALDSKTIDHVEVLKEKSAVEKFGEDGKNGVIVITTKKDKVLSLGKAKVDSTGIRFKETQAEQVPAYEEAFDVVEHMPEFPGGTEGLMTFLMENVRYPEAAHKAQTEGRVVVQFIVEKDGTVSNAKVVRRVSDDLDGEAVRVVGAMPKWKPGTQDNKPVRVKYTLPISFRLK